MPIFEFHCRECDATFDELVRSAGSTEPVVCSGCGSTRVERLLSSFAVGPEAPGGSSSEAGDEPPGPCGPACACFP